MEDHQIKTATEIKLKPNPYLKDVNIPFLYQRRMILMMLRRPRMVNGDDVGLGKTLSAIVHYTYLKTARPETKALVFTEKAALRQWEREFQWLTTGIKTKIITQELYPDKNLRVQVMRSGEYDVAITTYSMVYNYRQHLLEGLTPRFVTYADEPNYFKNLESKLHRGMLELSQHTARMYGLTATIVENKLEEAYGILRVICPGLIQSQAEFHKTFCHRRKLKGRRVTVTIGYKNLDLFRKTIEPGFYGRLQTDPEVKQELPEDIHKDVEIILNKEQSTKVVEAMERLIQLPTGEIKQVDILPSLILSQQLTNDPKLVGFDIESEKMSGLKEMLSNSLEGERVIVYSKLRSQIDRIQEELGKTGTETVRITGTEDNQQREIAMSRFMSDGPDRCNIILMNRAGLKAINLQKAAHIIPFDLPWSYGHYRQLVGRAKRTGSTNRKVGIYRMLGVLHPDVAALVGGEKTIDHYTLSVLNKKKKLFDAITGDITTIEDSTGDVMEVFNEIKASFKRKN